MVLGVGTSHPDDCCGILRHHIRLRHQGVARQDRDWALAPAVHLVADQANRQDFDAQAVLLTLHLRFRFGHYFINTFYLQFNQ
jgi:hypothetical protein